MKALKAKKSLKSDGLKVIRIIQKAGYQAYWVGGTVRDMLLGRPVDNVDIATSARPDEVQKLLRAAGFRTKSVGRAYGTILAASKGGIIEVTTFRKEGAYADRRRPQEIHFLDDYAQDSKRRDLTINALYYDPVHGKLLDPQDGLKDLNSRTMRFVGRATERIDEDALRMMRAARQATQLKFKLERNSFSAIKTRAKYIQEISGERIRAELDKILSLPNKEDGIRLLDALGLLRFIMPEVEALKNVWHKSKSYHLEGNVYEHTMLVLRNIRPHTPEMGYAALYHDTGKAVTAVPKNKAEGTVNSFPGHENVSAEMTLALSKRLKFSRKQAQLILWITKMHMTRGPFMKGMGEQAKADIAVHEYFPLLLEFWRADSLGNIRLVQGKPVAGDAKAYKEGRKLLANIHAKRKFIEKTATGDAIISTTGITRGQEVGAIKRRLIAEIIFGRIKTQIQAKKFLKEFSKLP